MHLYGTRPMSRDEHEFRIRPGRGRDLGKSSGKKVRRLAAQVKRAAAICPQSCGCRARHSPPSVSPPA